MQTNLGITRKNSYDNMNNLYKETKKQKKEQALKDFNFLLSVGNTGYYKACEVTQIFIFNKNKTTKEILNYYTLFCFDELDQLDDDTTKMGTLKATTDYGIGCQKKRITIEDARNCFSDIQNGFMNYDEPISVTKDLYLLPKTLIPKQSDGTAFLNDIIKPNYWGDNYIIEFYDETKTKFNNLNFGSDIIEEINKFTEEKIRINLSKPYDRIGNIIFQFPITICCSTIKSLRNSVDFEFLLYSHPELKYPKSFFINMRTQFDNVVTGFDCTKQKALTIEEKLSPGDDNTLTTLVVDEENHLLLHQSKVNFIRSFNIQFKIGMQYSEPRFIINRDKKKEEIELFSSTNTEDPHHKNDYFSRIFKRNLNNDIMLHSNDYQVFKNNQRKQALSFIRSKITNLSEIKEICLWDPYLNAFDIMETLYFENTGIPFRCITQYKKAKELDNNSGNGNDSFATFCTEQKQCFLVNSNNLRIKMRFLAQHSTYGWDFHDRFLILIPKEISNLPIAYSLGISVNQLGKSHHIIQKVPNPRKILSNFEDLWNLLDNGKCLVAEF